MTLNLLAFIAFSVCYLCWKRISCFNVTVIVDSTGNLMSGYQSCKILLLF